MADPQELELQVFVSCSVDAENQTQLPWVTQHSGLWNHLPSLKPFLKRPCLGLWVFHSGRAYCLKGFC